MIDAIESLPVPTLAAVQGLCLAGGLEVALACDLIWAAEGSMLGQPEATIGAIPFAGGAQRVAARAGTARALEIVYTGGFYPAERLLDWGVLNASSRRPTCWTKRARLRNASRTARRSPTPPQRRLSAPGARTASPPPTRSRPAGARVIASADLQSGVESLLSAVPARPPSRTPEKPRGSRGASDP